MSDRYRAMFPMGIKLPTDKVWPGFQAHNVFRDLFSIPQWLSFGAALQTLLFLLPVPRLYVALPALLFIAFNAIDAALVTMGLSRNTMMDRTIQTKYAGLIPDADGGFSNAARDDVAPSGDQKIVVMTLSARINHPLGPLAPGVREIGQHFNAMNKDLLDNRATNGLLSQSQYLSADGRRTKNEIMNYYHFNSVEALHDFAHGPIHRAGWDWYNTVHKKYPHIGIAHEAYIVAPGGIDAIYKNMEPNGFATAKFPRKSPTGETVFASTLIDATKGKLATSAGRLGVKATHVY